MKKTYKQKLTALMISGAMLVPFSSQAGIPTFDGGSITQTILQIYNATSTFAGNFVKDLFGIKSAEPNMAMSDAVKSNLTKSTQCSGLLLPSQVDICKEINVTRVSMMDLMDEERKVTKEYESKINELSDSRKSGTNNMNSASRDNNASEISMLQTSLETRKVQTDLKLDRYQKHIASLQTAQAEIAKGILDGQKQGATAQLISGAIQAGFLADAFGGGDYSNNEKFTAGTKNKANWGDGGVSSNANPTPKNAF